MFSSFNRSHFAALLAGGFLLIQLLVAPVPAGCTEATHDHSHSTRAVGVAAQDCYNCSGTGRCWNCSGTGRALNDSKCNMCSGSGLCYYCSGKGVR